MIKCNACLRIFFFCSLCEETSQGWGRIVARYVRDQWICLRFVLNKLPMLAQEYEEGTSELLLLTAERSKEILESALETLTILPSDQVLPVFDCMKILVPKVKDETTARYYLGVFVLSNLTHFFFFFSASELTGVSLHRSIRFSLENHILFEQYTASILV